MGRSNVIIVDAVRIRAEQGIVDAIGDGNGEASAEAGCAGKAPAVGQTIMATEDVADGEIIFVGDNEIVPNIK